MRNGGDLYKRMQNKVTEFWRELENKKIFLNEMQKKAVENTDGAMLLLAVPGAGKTLTLMVKIAYLLTVKEVLPQQIKAVSFSRAAAAEMKERFQKLFPIWQAADFSTIHSLAYAVMREFFQKKHIDFQLIEGSGMASKNQILREIYTAFYKDMATEDQIEELTTYISFVKNKMLPQEKWAGVCCSIRKAPEILAAYEKFKQQDESLLIDYDDILLWAERAFSEEEELLQRYQSRYSYVFTDESQDTSLVQHRLIAHLVEKSGNLCVVADDDQSIYRWRGADPEYLLEFRKHYPAALILYMEQNYRSAPEIVKAADFFIRRNKKRYVKAMFTENKQPGQIVLHKFMDDRQQVKYLVQQLQQEGGQKKTCAVLYRNHASSILLLHAFEQAGISFYIKDADLHFFSHWIVKDILNFMRLTYSLKRTDIFERIYMKMTGYITRNQMEALKKVNGEESVFDQLLHHVSMQEYQVEAIEQAKRTFQKMAGMAPKKVISCIRKQLGYEKALDRMSEQLGFRKESLWNILNTLEEISRDLPTMEEFARRLRQLEELAKNARQKQRQDVILSTLHSAKGQEFDRVYLIDLVQGVLPSFYDLEEKQAGHPEAMEEAVRLFYVGMTRAREHLELLSYDWRDQDKVIVSSFFTAIERYQQPLCHTGAKKRDGAVTPEPVRAEIDWLEPGTFVQHKFFGPGSILSVDNDRVEIAFKGGKKIVSLSVCLKNGLLEPV